MNLIEHLKASTRDIETGEPLYPDVFAMLTVTDVHNVLTALVDHAAEVERLERERDHWKDYSSGQGKLIESGVFVSNDEYVRLTSAEAKIAELEKALKPFSVFAKELFARNYNRSDPVVKLNGNSEFGRTEITLTFDAFLQARAALKEPESHD